MLDGGDDVTQKPRIPRKERREWELATLAHRVKYLKPQRRRTTQYSAQHELMVKTAHLQNVQINTKLNGWFLER